MNTVEVRNALERTTGTLAALETERERTAAKRAGLDKTDERETGRLTRRLEEISGEIKRNEKLRRELRADLKARAGDDG
jgi:hypothetical protein